MAASPILEKDGYGVEEKDAAGDVFPRNSCQCKSRRSVTHSSYKRRDRRVAQRGPNGRLKKSSLHGEQISWTVSAVVSILFDDREFVPCVQDMLERIQGDECHSSCDETHVPRSRGIRPRPRSMTRGKNSSSSDVALYKQSLRSSGIDATFFALESERRVLLHMAETSSSGGPLAPNPEGLLIGRPSTESRYVFTSRVALWDVECRLSATRSPPDRNSNHASTSAAQPSLAAALEKMGFTPANPPRRSDRENAARSGDPGTGVLPRGDRT